VTEALATDVLAQARTRGLKLATAESCTGGLVAAALTDIAGSSDVVECGFVTYSNAAKMRMLGVSADSLARHGAVSETVAREMAEGAIEGSGADMAVAVTGIAGPGGGSSAKPVGTVCFAIASRASAAVSSTEVFAEGARQGIRHAATLHALHLLSAAIGSQEPASGAP